MADISSDAWSFFVIFVKVGMERVINVIISIIIISISISIIIIIIIVILIGK